MITDFPEELYAEGTVSNCDEGLEAAKRVGFPVMIKASEGGGGKGILFMSGCIVNWEEVQL